MTRDTRFCDVCGKTLDREEKKYVGFSSDSIPSKFNNLCKRCRNKWLAGGLGE